MNELVAKGTPLRAIAADGGGTLSVGMPGEAAEPARPDSRGRVGPETSSGSPPPGAEIVVDLVRGGRLASLVIDGVNCWSRAIPIRFAGAPIRWLRMRAAYATAGSASGAGSTPSARPAAPRDPRHGDAQGLAARRHSTIETDLGPDWPFAGRVVQHFELRPARLHIRMEIHAEEPMPASIGWHPWFRRRLLAGRRHDGASSGFVAGASPPVELDLDAGAMLRAGRGRRSPLAEKVSRLPDPGTSASPTFGTHRSCAGRAFSS